MIVVNVKVVTSAENIESLRSGLIAMEEASRAEQGCLDYCFSVELNAANTLRITECWEDMAALKAHFASAHMATFQAGVADLAPTSLDVKCYEAREIDLPG